MKPKPSIGVVFITYHAKKHLPHCLPPFLQSPLNPRVLVVNSSSEDGTIELAREMGAETLVIPRDEFNHGTTREVARHHLNTDIVVMMTPDAYAKDNRVLEHLVAPLEQSTEVAASYARQIPHDDAGYFGSFSRRFNYPSEGHVRGIEDASTYGAYTYFCSDSCAAYKNQALDLVKGFPEVLLGEDTLVVAKLLQHNFKVAYAAEAIVKHSHDYSLWQEFQRHFDIGLARQAATGLFPKHTDNKRGRDYLQALFADLLRNKPRLLPYAVLQSAAKFAGYHLGRNSTRAPLWLKKQCSSQDFYWLKRTF